MIDREYRALAKLWHELEDAPAAEHEAALRYALEKLCDYIGAANASWTGITREANDDIYRGWRIRMNDHLHDAVRRRGLGRQIAERIASGEYDPHVASAAKLTGQAHCRLRGELMSEQDWRNSWSVHEIFAEDRLIDRLGGGIPLSSDCEIHFMLDRQEQDRPFLERERDLLHFFLLGAKGFLSSAMRAKGLLDSTSPLTQREQEILPFLLTDATEKEIARNIGIGHRTVHQHAESIYAKFGVRGRTGLMALWLGYRRDAYENIQNF